MDFSQIAILLVVAASFGIGAKLLKQPLLTGYILAGVILAFLGLIRYTPELSSMGQIGVTLLLFLLGMEIEIHDFGVLTKTSFIAGLVQVSLTTIAGFILAAFFGFSTLSALYIALSLAFSSTIIVVKLLSEKHEMDNLFGRLAVGILLVQDLIAMLVLMTLTGFEQGKAGNGGFLLIAVKAIFLIGLTLFLSKKLIPRLFERFVAHSHELMFIVSIAWALGFASFVKSGLGFSLEIGGFLAGLTLSNLSEHMQIATKARPLRDFFLVIFFLLLGTQLVLGEETLNILPSALLFSLFVLVVKPITIMFSLGFMGYKKRTSFITSVHLAQISEFSLILMAIGASLGHVGRGETSAIVLVGIITMTISTYASDKVDRLYKNMQGYLKIFERKHTKEEAFVTDIAMTDHIVLVGSDRAGKSLLKYFTKKGYQFLVVDFNPKMYTQLSAEGIPVVFGDITDLEVLERANVKNARLIVSTIGTVKDNLTILEYLSSVNIKPKTIFTAIAAEEAAKLYEKGASYVIVPEIVAGDYIRQILRIYGTRGEKLIKAGKSHFNRLVFT